MRMSIFTSIDDGQRAEKRKYKRKEKDWQKLLLGKNEEIERTVRDE